MASDLWRISDQYRGAPLDPADCDPDPIVQFRAWFQLAHAAGLPKVNAMTLATVDERGRPHARIVLLKDADEHGFVFFTNYDSDKGKQLTASPYAALVIYWDPLDRQVRIEGRVERVTAAESDAYFATRPIGSQLGAIASPQSQPIPTRKLLEDRVAELSAELGDEPPARPANWGGFRVVPDLVELWQGQPSRLHDRVRYRRSGEHWLRERLAP
ncbi:MAG TPA: pyridoxamine 5'-phosphate oxidase [Kofleriaceae bacterium]|nr:pyridoxamine 5'-phosphate oxidase [Kofleriaceae bacterium]